MLISDETPILTVNENTYTIDDYRALIGITEGASRDDLVYLAGQATSVFTELGAVASAADRAGFLISGQELAYVKDNLIPYSDEIYKISLMAPLARNQTETLKAQAYLTITSNLNIENADIASSYNTDYIKANHILILTQDRSTMEPYSAEKKAEAAKLAESILQRLKKGEDFDKLCDEYTEDPGHITQPDGYIFTKGEMVKEFEDAAYGLKDGEISDIVETSYGYHIIKRLPLPELDAETEGYIQSSLLNAEFNRLYSECMDTADIQPHMSPDEIADLLG